MSELEEGGKNGGGKLLFILLPLVFVGGIGMVFNNMSNSGLAVTNTLTCLQIYPYTCQNSNNVGCQSVPSSCIVSGNSISVLNKNSPFTFLFTGNIGGFWTALNSNGNSNHAPFDPNGGGGYYTANCIYNLVGMHNMTTNSFAASILSCTQSNSDNSNSTKANAFTFTNWNTNYQSTVQTIPFFSIANNATYVMDCYNQGWYYVTGQPSVGYSTLGCDYFIGAGYSPPQIPNVNPVFSFLLAVPANLATGGVMTGNMPTGYNHIPVFVQAQNWDTQFCTNSFTGIDVYYSSQSCVNMETWFTTPHSGGLQAGFFTPFLTIVIGLVIFLIGLGINIRGGGSIFGSGTTLGVGVNQQGTRLAQVIGLGLIIWSPLYSEFGGWIISLPIGINALILLVMPGLFVFGLYERL